MPTAFTSSGVAKSRPLAAARERVARASCSVARGDRPSVSPWCARLVSAMSTRYDLSGSARWTPADRGGHLEHLGRGDDVLELSERGGRALGVEDAELGRTPGVAERQAHEEAVELALRQAVRALLLDRVLRRRHHERRAAAA